MKHLTLGSFRPASILVLALVATGMNGCVTHVVEETTTAVVAPDYGRAANIRTGIDTEIFCVGWADFPVEGWQRLDCDADEASQMIDPLTRRTWIRTDGEWRLSKGSVLVDGRWRNAVGGQP